jgi:hypothetical protein
MVEMSNEMKVMESKFNQEISKLQNNEEVLKEKIRATHH